MNTLYFITSNKRKYQDLTDRIYEHDWNLVHYNRELHEIQSLDGLEITKHKLRQAMQLVPDKKVIVEDRGFFIPALKGFPGTFVKLILQSIGIDGILQLMDKQKDRTAKFVSILGYYDGQKEHYFVDEEIGLLTSTRQGTHDRGWTELMYIYSHSTFPHKTLAELSDKEWTTYMSTISQNDYIHQFISFLNSSK